MAFWLGDGIGRRPDQCGLLFDIHEMAAYGAFNIEVYEVVPGAFAAGKHDYLIHKIRTNRLVRDYPFHSPAVLLFPFGAKIHIDYAVEEYDWMPPSGDQIKTVVDTVMNPDTGVFAGETMPSLLMPKPR